MNKLKIAVDAVSGITKAIEGIGLNILMVRPHDKEILAHTDDFNEFEKLANGLPITRERITPGSVKYSVSICGWRVTNIQFINGEEEF